MELNRDFSEFIECFVARDVRFSVPVIGRAELRRNKLATGRLRDLADVEDLGPGPGS